MTEKTNKTPEVRIGKKVKRISLQRYLISQVVWDTKSSDFRTLAGLLENQLWLENKASSDTNFLQKYGQELDSIAKILKEARFDTGFSIRALLRIRKKFAGLEHFLVPQRNYGQFKQRFQNAVQLHSAKPLGTLKKFIPPERYIGIGYSDKGQAKNIAEDGSPSWQDVASASPSDAKSILKQMIENADSVQEIKDVIRRYQEILDQKSERDRESTDDGASPVPEVQTKEAERSKTEAQG